ncbi:MAG TPA: glutamate ABC transporter substrate-binding protein [Egicoccus sp.]|nr:glutamate ABC transporter substrate-binding protein [Egicoccus sp.]HSK23900.1 glutamate ABC transporter substrate-binding protein [Egicoccus sp.]
MRMQKKSWRIAATLAAAALVVTACGDDGGDGGDGEGSAAEAPEFEEGSTMAEIQEAGTLRVGTKYDQPLFGVNTPSGVEGFDAEIAKLIAEGIWGEGGADNIEWSEAVSAVREQVLQEDQVDIVVATYTINDDRKELVGFAGPYYHAGQDIMVADGNPEGIEGVEDLSGKTVCSAEGSTSIENLREMVPDAEEIIALDTYSACAEELAQGRVDAVSTDNVILLGLIDERGEFELVDNPFTEEPYGIGVQLEADDFRDWINDRLEAIYESGEWAEAWESTAGAISSTPEPPEVDRY